MKVNEKLFKLFHYTVEQQLQMDQVKRTALLNYLKFISSYFTYGNHYFELA